jgi:hypothetical protein
LDAVLGHDAKQTEVIMAQLNVSASNPLKTQEGAPAAPISNEQLLLRSVLSCLLWEKEFYHDGVAIAERIVQLAEACDPHFVAKLAIAARKQFKLRHVPLLLLTVLARTGAGSSLVRTTLQTVIHRADEPAEFLALYWRNGKMPLSSQVKKGLAGALRKFDAYQLAKYNRPNVVKLRDVLFLTHAKPKDEEQAATWKKLVDGSLDPPDTWEVSLSAGADKNATFTRLLQEETLGYLALLRNLRGMVTAGVDYALIRRAILARRGADMVLPFRYVAAARACPQMEPALDQALAAALDGMVRLSGRTIVLVDVSGSMRHPLSSRSDLTRLDAAAALASIIPCDQLQVFSFSHILVEVPPRRGMAGIDAIDRSQPHGATYLGAAVTQINAMAHDRLIVVTDEQSHDPVPAPVARFAYMINVASGQNGVGYRNGWTHFDGFSEGVFRFIDQVESGAFADSLFSRNVSKPKPSEAEVSDSGAPVSTDKHGLMTRIGAFFAKFGLR